MNYDYGEIYIMSPKRDSVDEPDALWSKPEIRDVIEARLRSPGGLQIK